MNNVERFEALMATVERNGVDKLMEYIRKSDFYTAPASTKYHNCYEGGLLDHSLNVYDNLVRKKESDPIWKEKLENLSPESAIIVGLLHDICKTGYYTTEMRNKKIDGRWEQVPFYTVKDLLPYGHGEKSVMMIDKFIDLTMEEKYAIRWHMGPYSGEKDWQTLAAAMQKCPLILAVFEADMEATYINEKEG